MGLYDIIQLPLLNPCILILEMYQLWKGLLPVRKNKLLLLVEKYSASTLLTANKNSYKPDTGTSRVTCCQMMFTVPMCKNLV
jgi:hypothetical protein